MREASEAGGESRILHPRGIRWQDMFWLPPAIPVFTVQLLARSFALLVAIH
jgi:hypothetical protein